MEFRLWSEVNKESKIDLKPDFGLRSWDEISKEDRYKVWKYLEDFFYDKDPKLSNIHPDSDEMGRYYKFALANSSMSLYLKKRIFNSVLSINNLYKAHTFAPHFLEANTLTNACVDFYNIFINLGHNVVIELLSFYCKETIFERSGTSFEKVSQETKEEFSRRKERYLWEPFEMFATTLNDVFSHFGINVYLTKSGFVPRQEPKLLSEVYEPVIQALSSPQWKEVNQILSDAFKDYRENTPAGYSICITNTISAVQAFLQILVNGKTGTGDISKLIPQAQAKSLIPKDPFTDGIFKNLEAILMRERQETSIAHPKKEYATEKNARLILNLSMVFIQHCIQA